jgi:hypothetical protein
MLQGQAQPSQSAPPSQAPETQVPMQIRDMYRIHEPQVDDKGMIAWAMAGAHHAASTTELFQAAAAEVSQLEV